MPALELEPIFLADMVAVLLVMQVLLGVRRQQANNRFNVLAAAFGVSALGWALCLVAGRQPWVMRLFEVVIAEQGVLLLIGSSVWLRRRQPLCVLLLLAAPIVAAVEIWRELSVLPLLATAGGLMLLGFAAFIISLLHPLKEVRRSLASIFTTAALATAALQVLALIEGLTISHWTAGLLTTGYLLMGVCLQGALLEHQKQLVKIAEQAKRGALKRLLMSRRRMTDLSNCLEAMSDHISDAVLMCDDKGRVVSLNRAAEKIFGYSAEAAIGRRLECLFTAEAWQIFVRETANDALLQKESEYRLEGLHSSGRQLPLLCRVRVLNGEPQQRLVIVQDISESQRQQARLDFFAAHDSLTGLSNRHYFEKQLTKILADNAHGWVLFVDLDDFKLINDALGHHAGDTALIAMSKRLQDTLGEEALVARYSGDEFAIYVSATSDWHEAELLDSVRRLLQQPIASSSVEFGLSASLGVVRVPEHGATIAELMKHADLAVSKAKRDGKNKAFLYNASLQQEMGRKAQMATRLKSLDLDNELSVFLQPRVRLPGRELSGAEALLRWRTPEGELISPEQFVPVAEETGQILRIGYWVMEETCRWLAHSGAYQDPFVVSVNLSPRQLFDEQLVERIEALRQRYGLAAAQLEFEITEGAAMQNLEYAISVLSRLRALGYGLSLDDFGTGFSSLSQLRHLPVDILKIDQSFVQNMVTDRHDRVMVAAIVELGAQLGLTVLAEGVENRDQERLLNRLGCNEIQGYLVSKPTPMASFTEEILSDWSEFSRSVGW